MAGNRGQMAGNKGQMAGNKGQMAGNKGQMAGNKGQMGGDRIHPCKVALKLQMHPFFRLDFLLSGLIKSTHPTSCKIRTPTFGTQF